MHRIFCNFVATLLLAVAGLLPAPEALAQKAPDELVKSVAEDVLAIVRQDRALREGDTSRMAQLIEEKIVPHFDFERMTRLAVGRAWRQATPEQRQQLIDEFRRLLVRSYSAAYSTYNHIVVEVKPLKLQAGEEDVQVKTLIKLPGGAPPVSVDYSMVNNSPDWKVYDVVVDGISLVTTYRTTFAEEVNKGGIEGLIKSLAALNAAKTAQRPVGATRRQ
ncbi:MAG TPA: ABC transporter substrate-binding protein [Burkholderiales bacterium]|jgi:phospholipid transport system substrate-binding protein